MNCIHPNGKILVVISEGNRFNNYETEYDRRNCECNKVTTSNPELTSNLNVSCPRCSGKLQIATATILNQLRRENGSWTTCAALACSNPIKFVCINSRSYNKVSESCCSWRCEQHVNSNPPSIK